jgi:hypothetical protein
VAYLLIFLTRPPFSRPNKSTVRSCAHHRGRQPRRTYPATDALADAHRVRLGHIGIAFAVLATLALIGIPLTIRNYRSIYR